MAFSCPKTRSYSCDEHEEGRDRKESRRDRIDYYSRNNSKGKDSSPNPYLTNSSGKEVTIKRGRPRKQWNEHSEARQNMFYQETKYDDGQIPSLALPIQPTNQHSQDDSVIRQHLRSMDGIRKHTSRRVNKLLSEPRPSLSAEDKLYYPTRTEIGSVFAPARGQCCGPCCHGNARKYSESYFLPCYPLVVRDEQGASPRLERDICYSNSHQQHNYSLAQSPPPKNPIIIDCFSLAIDGNKEEMSETSLNQETTVARHGQYEEQEPWANNVTNQSKFQHDCIICQQIATGEVLPQLRSPSGAHHNECGYRETNQANSRSTASSTGHNKDESSWHNTAIKRNDVYGKTSREKRPRSPEDVGIDQKHEEPDSKGVMMTMKEEKRMVIKSAFSSPNEKRSKKNDYESNLQVLRRQETQVINTRATILHAEPQESSPSKNPNNLPPYHPSAQYYTATNTEPLHSPDNTTANSRDDLQRKWEAMYHILEEPDKANKKSYFCSHCGRAFTHLSSLNNHIRTHTGQKPFRCRYCGKRFAQSGVLTAHLRTHTGEKPFNCILCGKRFAQTTTLANHIRTHTGQKPFSCRYCKRTFAQSSTRNKHELSHTKEKPFECKYCGRSFTQSATVMRHMRIHMRDTKYSCVHCGKTFAYLYSLDKHLDEHT